MRVLVVGGGPAGLYFAGLYKQTFPGHRVTVIEQTPADRTYGFGVVFSDSALGRLAQADPLLYRQIAPRLERWPDLTITHRDQPVVVDGNGFAGIARLALLRLLGEQAARAGVDIRYGRRAAIADLDGQDLVVGADGVNSTVAGAGAFERPVHWLSNRFIWYGTPRRFDTLSLTFRSSPDGHFVAHHYRYSATMSTFIIECDAATFQAAGFGAMPANEARRYCESLFAADLAGQPLVSNRSEWRRFPLMQARRWSEGNMVLVGDALRSMHFSIGSGTRMALEDALALWRACRDCPEDVPAALGAFEAAHRPVVDKLVAAASESSFWYEALPHRMRRNPVDLAHDYMTRSGRVDDDRLRRIAPKFMALRDQCNRDATQRRR